MTPGGSSGGAAAAVAAGILPLAHANDGGGSIRIPAVVLRPVRAQADARSNARRPRPRRSCWGGFAIAHVVSRSVRDSAAMLDAIAGPEPTSPYWAPPVARPFAAEVGAPPGRLRIALTKRPFVTTVAPHPDCVAAADDAAAPAAPSWGTTSRRRTCDIDGDAFARDFFVLVCVENAALLARAEQALGRRARRGDIETNTALVATIGRQQTGAPAPRWRVTGWRPLSARAAPVADRFDLVLSPTLGLPPVGIGALAPRGAEAFAHDALVALRLGFLLRLPGVVEATVRKVFAFIPFTPLANVSGQPAMSVPLSWNAAGLPIGVQLQARFGDEATLFRVAAQLEAARPWADRRPPVHADAAS